MHVRGRKVRRPGVRSTRIMLIVLCCLLPLVALASTVFLHTPVAATGILALIVLVPIAVLLMAET